MPHPVVGADATVKFTPKAAGKYRVRVTDARTLGGPAYVYRLTVTTAKVPTIEFPLKGNDGLKDVTDAGEGTRFRRAQRAGRTARRSRASGRWS